MEKLLGPSNPSAKLKLKDKSLKGHFKAHYNTFPFSINLRIFTKLIV